MVHLESYALNVVLLAACAIPALSPSATEPTPTDPPGGHDPVVVETTFPGVFTPGVPAVTYDPAAVPQASKVWVTITGDGKTQKLMMAVAGVGPDRAFGASLHVNGCGPSGLDAGPHYQHIIDPAATPEHPSTDPVYANPENEVRLEFSTDDSGIGASTAVHPWPFDPETPPRSLIIYAGNTPARLACVNIPWT